MAVIAEAKNNKQIVLRKMFLNDIDDLVYYLDHLGDDTKKRFGPHSFDKNSINHLYINPEQYAGYLAIDIITSGIVAYSVVKAGYLEHDSARLQSYGLIADSTTDCTFAPSVADAWQDYGVGNILFNFMLPDLKTKYKRIILWGGVQTANSHAIRFYEKIGFATLGYFEYNGLNADMILYIA